MSSFGDIGSGVNKVFGGYCAGGVKVKAQHRLSVTDSLTASAYTRLAKPDSDATTSLSLVPKFKISTSDYALSAAVFAGSNAPPQLQLSASLFNFLVNGLRNTVTFATPSYGANSKDRNPNTTLTTNTRYYAESSGAVVDATSDLVRGSGTFAVALGLPESTVAGFKAYIEQGVGIKSLDVAAQLGATGFSLLGAGLGAATAPVWTASYFTRLSQTLAIGADIDTLHNVRVGAAHDATPFTALKYKLDNKARVAVNVDTVLSSSFTASFGVDFDSSNQRDLKWGLSLKFQ